MFGLIHGHVAAAPGARWQRKERIEKEVFHLGLHNREIEGAASITLQLVRLVHGGIDVGTERWQARNRALTERVLGLDVKR